MDEDFAREDEWERPREDSYRDMIATAEHNIIGRGKRFKTREQFILGLQLTCEHFGLDRIDDTNHFSKLSPAQTFVLAPVLGYTEAKLIKFFSLVRTAGAMDRGASKASVKPADVIDYINHELPDLLRVADKKQRSVTIKNTPDTDKPASAKKKPLPATPLPEPTAPAKPEVPPMEDLPCPEMKDVKYPLGLGHIGREKNATTVLNDAIAEKKDFVGFINMLTSEWNINHTQLRKFITKNYKVQTGKKGEIAEGTLKGWLTHDTTKPFRPDPYGIEVLRIGLGMDQAAEMRLWKLIRGHELQNLNALIDNAEKGETGPLVRGLIAASGIPGSHLEKLLPAESSVLKGWKDGAKINKPEIIQRLLTFTHPSRNAQGVVDPEIALQNGRIAAAVRYKAVVTAEALENRASTIKIQHDENTQRVDKAIESHPLSDFLKNGAEKKEGWATILNHALHTWDASPQDWQEWMERHHPKGEAVSLHTIYEWLKTPEVKSISPSSVAIITEAHGLDELSEKRLWKAKAGYYLGKDALKDAVSEARTAGNPQPLVNLLTKSAGVQEARLKEILKQAELGKWLRHSGNIGRRETAEKLVTATMAVERDFMEESMRTRFDQEVVPELTAILTGRPKDVAEVLSPMRDKRPKNAGDFIGMLCSDEGIRTLSNEQFAQVTGLPGTASARNKRSGYSLLTEKEQDRLLSHYGCNDPEHRAAAKELLAIRRIKGHTLY